MIESKSVALYTPITLIQRIDVSEAKQRIRLMWLWMRGDGTTGSDVYATGCRRKWFGVWHKIRASRSSRISHCKRLSADDWESQLECWRTAEQLYQSRNRQLSQLICSRSYKYVTVMRSLELVICINDCTNYLWKITSETNGHNGQMSYKSELWTKEIDCKRDNTMPRKITL